MEFIADILLVAGALGAAFYCVVLSRRLNRFNNLETGVGGAVAVLSGQVDDLSNMLATAQKNSSASEARLQKLVTEAEETAARLELLLASLHDLPEPAAQMPSEEPMFKRHPDPDQGVVT
ncbi:hypothetical protein [Thalassobius sp. MITS945101]|uniref:hypothetical protein n=1 Tax=Thalassobius sp. MITS945101 TaxID=3096994 RepID=UPI00399A4A85